MAKKITINDEFERIANKWTNKSFYGSYELSTSVVIFTHTMDDGFKSIAIKGEYDKKGKPFQKKPREGWGKGRTILADFYSTEENDYVVFMDDPRSIENLNDDNPRKEVLLKIIKDFKLKWNPKESFWISK